MMKAGRLLLIFFLSFGGWNLNADPTSDLVKTLEIFYLKPEMRSSADTIQIVNGVASISVWRDLPSDPNPEKIECLGYQWLLSGRGEKMGEGAREAFQKFPELQNIQLQFVELDQKTKSTDKRGKLEKIIESKTFLRMSIDRSAALSIKLDAKALKSELRKSSSACLSLGREIVKTREVNL